MDALSNPSPPAKIKKARHQAGIFILWVSMGETLVRFDKFVRNKFERRRGLTAAPKGWSTGMYGIILVLPTFRKQPHRAILVPPLFSFLWFLSALKAVQYGIILALP